MPFDKVELMQTLTKHAKQIIANERERYLALHPTSIALSKRANAHFLYGVPMHWMNDWGTPVPLFAAQANGAHFTCADNRSPLKIEFSINFERNFSINLNFTLNSPIF